MTKLTSILQSINNTIDPYKQLRMIIKDSVVYDTLPIENKYMAKEFAYNMLNNNPNILTLGTSNDIVFQNFHNTLINTNIGNFAKVQKFIGNKNFAAARALNTTIIPQNMMETNSKEVNRICLNRIVMDSTVSTIDSLTLVNIALQSPSTGGKAVYRARAILDIYPLPLVQQNNSLLPQTVQTITENNSAINVYPNPATDKLFVETNNYLEGTATLELFDVTGKLCFNTTIIATLNLQTIDISNVKKGIYNLRIITKNKTANQKLIIIK